MLNILFVILMIWIFGKILLLGLKATWSVFKIIVTVVLLPLILIGLVLIGLIYLAIPLLVIIGIVVSVSGRT